MSFARRNPLLSARPVRRRWGRSLLLAVALLGLWGCSLVSRVAPGGAPPAAASLAAPQPAVSLEAFSPTPPPSVAPLPSQTPTPLPSDTATPAPSQTPLLPSALPTLTSVATSTPGLSFGVTPIALYGKCCTLRVRNAGSIPLWIGKGPKAGSVIKPLWYLEFYYDKPQTARIYWCLHLPVSKATPDELPPHAPGAPDLYECRHRDVYVEPGVTEMSVVQ